MMSFKKIMIVDGGTKGCQIAFQIAFSGFDVALYETNPKDIQSIKRYLNILKSHYKDELKATQSHIDEAYNMITFVHSIDVGIKDADLVIESMSESKGSQNNFYQEIDKKANHETIFATTHSNLLSSDVLNTINHKDKCIAVNFLSEPWLRNIVEVIGTPGTDLSAYDKVLHFLESIKMITIPVRQNEPYSILNSLLIPFISAASYLIGNDVADVITIDKTWMKATGDLQGPFGLQDIIGLDTTLDILKLKNETNKDMWKQNYIDIVNAMIKDGKLGKLSGQGFYKYPNPIFEKSNFFDAPTYIQNLTHGFKNITIAGGGVLGSQVAFQVASGGFEVNLYDINENALNKAKERIDNIKVQYEKDMGVSKNEVNSIAHNINYYSNLFEATNNSDLIIEVVPENHEVKEKFYKQLAQVMPEKTYVVTNSSTLRPSDFEAYTGRPKKFAALHFANHVWINNTGEVMVAHETSEETFNKILAFARDINLTVLPIKKEQPGYILNTLLVPLLTAAQRLSALGITDFKMIDKAWMIATQSKKGPFAILDIVGLNTAYNIALDSYKRTQSSIDKRIVDFLKEKVNNNELGIGVGKGFYDYTNGAPYESKDFFK
ncbi:TPA: 3-hydroxyacyl-CoA dehydrogenase [Staphylococcus aureus]|nr:3-hydroxyacyl-CoA dehydrogenase [Staphylococcus aureus]